MTPTFSCLVCKWSGKRRQSIARKCPKCESPHVYENGIDVASMVEDVMRRDPQIFWRIVSSRFVPISDWAKLDGIRSTRITPGGEVVAKIWVELGMHVWETSLSRGYEPSELAAQAKADEALKSEHPYYCLIRSRA